MQNTANANNFLIRPLIRVALPYLVCAHYTHFWAARLRRSIEDTKAVVVNKVHVETTFMLLRYLVVPCLL